MNEIKSFQDLIAWQKAYDLTKKVYIVTRKFPDEEKFGLTSQIRRAAVSVGSNIVEGFARKGIKDGLSFYNIANASLEELKFQLLLGRDFNYLSEEDFRGVYDLANETGKVLRGWTNTQQA